MQIWKACFGTGAVALALLRVSAQSIPSAAQAPSQAVQVAVSAKVLDGYVGRYQLAPKFFITMTRDGDHLSTQGTGQESFSLFPASEKEFFAKVAPIRITFLTDADGKATGFVLHQGGSNVEAKLQTAPRAESLKAKCVEIDATAAAEYAKHPIGSLTVGVVAGKKLIWTKSYGDADIEKKIPADKDTVYRIGWITKMFTAVMLEQLADAGTVHLSDAAEKYLPAIKMVKDRLPGAPSVTLFQLATHTSGMGREPDDVDKYVNGPAAEWEKSLSAALANAHYKDEPGTRFSYSNIGYAALGEALSRAAGESYLNYVPKAIFGPLGMTHTTLVYKPEMASHLSEGYQTGPGGKVDSKLSTQERLEGRGYKVPNGAIYTTVGDLAQFASFLLGDGPDNVLSKSSLERYLTQSPVQADFQLDTGYGLGTFVFHRTGYTAFGHSGSVAGYQAAMYLNRDSEIGTIVLANELGPGTVDSDGMALRMLDLLSK